MKPKKEVLSKVVQSTDARIALEVCGLAASAGSDVEPEQREHNLCERELVRREQLFRQGVLPAVQS